VKRNRMAEMTGRIAYYLKDGHTSIGLASSGLNPRTANKIRPH
jgi:hypothetical protein